MCDWAVEKECVFFLQRLNGSIVPVILENFHVKWWFTPKVVPTAYGTFPMYTFIYLGRWSKPRLVVLYWRWYYLVIWGLFHLYWSPLANQDSMACHGISFTGFEHCSFGKITFDLQTLMCCHMGVSWNNGTPKHPKMIIFSRKTHGCWVPSFSETPISPSCFLTTLKFVLFWCLRRSLKFVLEPRCGAIEKNKNYMQRTLLLLLMDKILHHQGWWLSHYL